MGCKKKKKEKRKVGPKYTFQCGNGITRWVCSKSGFGSLVKNRIFYFLSALNSIQPLLLRQKLRAMQPDNAKVSWIIDYLADRPQFVPSQSTVLDLQLQRGTALSTLFTSFDSRPNSGSRFLWPFLHHGLQLYWDTSPKKMTFHPFITHFFVVLGLFSKWCDHSVWQGERILNRDEYGGHVL